MLRLWLILTLDNGEADIGLCSLILIDTDYESG